MGLTANRIADRFEQNVHIVPFSTCHYWGGPINNQGYGMLGVNGRAERAHRISYELYKGEIPIIDGKPAVIRHKCDTPLCVNPDHLEPGTQADNMRDAAERGRMPKGETHHSSTVTNAMLADIAQAIRDGAAGKDIAAQFGVSASYVATLRHGRGRVKIGPKPTGRSDRRISDDAARKIYALAHAGSLSPSRIAAACGVTRTMVVDIKRGVTYASVTGHRR